MSIFDDLTEVVSAAGSEVAERAKAVKDEVEITLRISKAKKKLKKYHVSIGKKYVKLHENDFEEDFAEDIAHVQDLHEEIDALYASLEELKSEYAQTEESGDDTEAEAEEKKTFCPYCGNPASADYIFCPVCGKSLKKEAAPEAAETVEETAEEASEAIKEAVETAAEE